MAKLSAHRNSDLINSRIIHEQTLDVTLYCTRVNGNVNNCTEVMFTKNYENKSTHIQCDEENE